MAILHLNKSVSATWQEHTMHICNGTENKYNN